VPGPIRRDPIRRVPEVIFHFLHMPAVRDEQRGARVAQVVKTQLLREAGAGHRERKWRRRRCARRPSRVSWTAAGAALSAARWIRRSPQPRCGLCRSGADNSAVLAQTSEPAVLEGLAGLDWGVDRRDLAERVGHCLFHVPAPPDDQLAFPVVLGDRGRDHVER
jgi:hypothetical protein